MSDLAWGLGMTVAGMGTVFALLLLLMALLYLIGWLDRPKPEPAAVGGSTSSVPGATAAAAIGSPPDAHIDAEASRSRLPRACGSSPTGSPRTNSRRSPWPS